jgi:hypothetical protein
MIYTNHRNLSRKLDKKVKNIFDLEIVKFMFTFKLRNGMNGYGMELNFDYSIPIKKNLRYIEKGNKVLLGFEIPDEWKLQGIHVSEGCDSEMDEVYWKFMEGMRTLKYANKKAYDECSNNFGKDVLSCLRSEIENNDWYRYEIIEKTVLKLLNECRLKYRVKRVTGGLFTNPDNICPLYEFDFDSDTLYIVRGRGFAKYDKPLSQVSTSDLVSSKSIKFNSFEGRFSGYCNCVEKARINIL